MTIYRAEVKIQCGILAIQIEKYICANIFGAKSNHEAARVGLSSHFEGVGTVCGVAIGCVVAIIGFIRRAKIHQPLFAVRRIAQIHGFGVAVPR